MKTCFVLGTFISGFGPACFLGPRKRTLRTQILPIAFITVKLRRPGLSRSLTMEWLSVWSALYGQESLGSSVFPLALARSLTASA